jgi:hypothetical protein
MGNHTTLDRLYPIKNQLLAFADCLEGLGEVDIHKETPYGLSLLLCNIINDISDLQEEVEKDYKKDRKYEA